MKALIVAAGSSPSAEMLQRGLAKADITIAADNGIEPLARAGAVPQVIVGDMDSACPELLEELRRQGSELLLLEKEKNETDTQKAVEEAVRRGATDILLLGGTGGRIDHTLSNMALLKWAMQHGVRLVIEDERHIIEIGAGRFAIHGRKGQTVSILPVDEAACVTAEGLYYPLEELVLTNAESRGVSNLFNGGEAVLRTDRPVFVIKIKENGDDRI